jgi:hypothetical protein
MVHFSQMSRHAWLERRGRVTAALAVIGFMATAAPVAAKPLGDDPHICQVSMNLCMHRCGPPAHNIHQVECTLACFAEDRACLKQVAFNNALQHPPPPSLSTSGSGGGGGSVSQQGQQGRHPIGAQ